MPRRGHWCRPRSDRSAAGPAARPGPARSRGRSGRCRRSWSTSRDGTRVLVDHGSAPGRCRRPAAGTTPRRSAARRRPAAGESHSPVASMALSIRLPSIVTASCGSIRIARRYDSGRICSCTPRSEACGHLAEQQRGDHRVIDRADHLVGQQLSDLEFLGGEGHGVLGPADLDQRDHGVQSVGGLVILRAQRVREAAYGVQLAGQGLDLGVVPEGDHRPEIMIIPPRRPAVEHQHPGVDQMDLVGHRLTARRARTPDSPAVRPRRSVSR